MQLNRRPGTYLLWLRSESEGECRIGRLGQLMLTKGYYAYVGSALGPGGLAARIKHHLAPIRRPHWHIDHLRQAVQVSEIWYAEGTQRLEHQWAAKLHRLPESRLALPGFGSSDCRCPAHLFQFRNLPPKRLLSLESETGLQYWKVSCESAAQ
ncbi:MAG: GIY-YIG nuclease family protein [Methylohalobius sp. ZOD2]